MVMEMAPILLAALLIDALFGLWRPRALRDMRPDLVQARLRRALSQDVLPGLDRRVLGAAVLVFGLGLAIALGWLLASLPFAGLWTLALAALLLGMKHLSHQAHAVADALRDSPEAARAAYQRFHGSDAAAPPVSDIAPATYGALMPRMAWKLTGRPIIFSWRTPRKSVHGWSISNASSKAVRASSPAIWRMRVAGMPQRSATASGA